MATPADSKKAPVEPESTGEGTSREASGEATREMLGKKNRILYRRGCAQQKLG